ncbi:MAG: hypothetical protein SOR74_07460 [Candidatus Faecivicinus sp.]|nr:hypothetical protein [Candidatus Faecivicinus sp.]
MALYDEYPQFDGLTASVLSRLIIEARLAPSDVQIAASRLVWGMDYADIASAVGMDRSAVSKRLRAQIVPRIELVLRECDKCG